MDIWDFPQPGLDAHKKPSTVGNLRADLPPRITYMYIYIYIHISIYVISHTHTYTAWKMCIVYPLVN